MSSETLPLPIPDGYYRIRSTAGSKHAIMMKYREALENRPHCTSEPDMTDGSQTFYIRHNPFTDTYTFLHSGTGLYLGTLMKPNWEAWGAMGVTKPLPWKMNVVNNPKVGLGYRIFLPGHPDAIDRKGVFLSAWDGCANAGEKIGTTWCERDWDWIRGWKFESVPAPSDLSNIRPLTTLPPLLPGVFRIQNIGAQTVLDQSDEDFKSPILGNKPKVTKKSQEWLVSIDKETQLFVLKSNYDAYLGIDSVDGTLVSCEQPQLWDIRQGEQPEQFLIGLPGINRVLHVQDITNNFMNIITEERDRDRSDLQRWSFIPRTIDLNQMTQATPPIFPTLCNGTYRIVNQQTGKVLVESNQLIPKADHTGKIAAIVTYQSHEHGNQHEFWIIEVQPKVLTYTIRNYASGRYLVPPYMTSREGAGKKTSIYTSNGAFLWDIRQTWFDKTFTIHVPGTAFVVWCEQRSTTGELCMWTRSEPPEGWEEFRFERTGDWAPALFPQTFSEIEALSRDVAEVAASPSLHRDPGWMEVVVDYMQKALKIDSAHHHPH